MRIDPSGTYSPVASNPISTNVNSAAGRAIEQPASSIEDSSFTRTGDLKRLLQFVREAPEVRANVVSDVATRLAIGEFATQSAAADTAQAFLEQEVPKSA